METAVEQKPYSFSIRLIACVFVAYGVTSLWHAISEMLKGGLNIDLGVLGIFVGRGLLTRSNGWRKFALFITILFLFTVPIIMCIHYYLTGGHEWEFTVFDIHMPFPFYVSAIGVGLLYLYNIWQYRILTRPQVKQSFENPEPANPNDLLWWKVLVVILFLLGIPVFIAELSVTSYLKKLDFHQVKVWALDKDTHTYLNLNTSSEFTSRGKIFPKAYFISYSENGHMGREVQWIDAGPIKIGVGARGYETQEVELTGEEENGELLVYLEKQLKAEPKEETSPLPAKEGGNKP